MPRKGNQRIQSYTGTTRLTRPWEGGTSKPCVRDCRSPWIEYLRLRTRNSGRKAVGKLCSVIWGDLIQVQIKHPRRQVVNREHTGGQRTHGEEANPATAGVTPHPPRLAARHTLEQRAGLGTGVDGEAGRAPSPRPAAPLGSALRRGERERHGGRLYSETAPGTLRGGWGREVDQVFVGGSRRRERFPLTAKPPAHQGFPSRSGPPPPQRHALHNLSGEGSQGADSGGPGLAPLPLLPPPGRRGPGRAEGHRGSAGRTRGRRRGAHRGLRRGSWQGVGRAAPPGSAQAGPAAARWTHGGSLAARHRVFS